MARTYYAEGRQLAYFLRGTFVMLTLGLWYFIPSIHWGVFFGLLFAGLIAAEIMGVIWTRKRRREKKATTRKAQSETTTKTSAAKLSKVLTEQQLLTADINTLSGTDFERLMEMYYKDQGYSVQRVGGAGDHEVDLILKGKEGYKIAVQCKRWKKDVGNDIVLRLKAGKQVHGCYDAWIVTTSNYTKAARYAAEKLNIQLINGLMLDARLKKWKATH